MKITPISRFTINGNSMLPTLKPGQDVLCFNWAYLFAKPKVGDIVVIKIQGRYMVKRIHYLNDRVINVVGDNIYESNDSRDFGPISYKDIVGRAVFMR